jgi:CheY-like chemotaxis protein
MHIQTLQQYVLWADDDPGDRSMVVEVLRENNYPVDVVEAENGREALDYLQSVHASDHLPCLIVLDLNMPQLNGKQTLQALKEKEQYHSIPIVVFTTSSSDADKEFYKKYQVPLFTKPINYRALNTTICEILGYCERSATAQSCTTYNDPWETNLGST